MARAQVLSQAKLKLFEIALPNASEATMETMEILMDIDQMSMLLSSMDDMRKGQVVGLCDAFADL